MRRRALLAATGSLALLAAAGCATRPDPGWLAGRLVVLGGDPGTAAWSAAFELRGDAAAGELRLSSPFGTTIAVATWDAVGARLESAEGTMAFDDLDALARRALGEPVPLRALPDWLRGRPWPGAPAEAGAGGFRQLGWQVDTEGLAVGRIEARRLLSPGRIVRVRLDGA
ncbi:MAG: outer membrane lipoprotein LolB [Rubrivivax sp.]|nr:outer membrane lipoprotein LolB [Rubrivivax sp.]